MKWVPEGAQSGVLEMPPEISVRTWPSGSEISSTSHPNTVIIITEKPSSRSEAFYLDKGANGFFRKPIDGQALMALIDHLLT